MRLGSILRIAAALALALPGAAAAPHVEPSDNPARDAVFCPLVYFILGETPCRPAATVTMDDGATYYVAGGPAGLHEESNGCEGYQARAGACDGAARDRSYQAATLPEAGVDLGGARDAPWCLATELIGPEREPEPCGDAAALRADGATYYVGLQPFNVYRETNGCPGLQARAGECPHDGRAVGPDQGGLLT